MTREEEIAHAKQMQKSQWAVERAAKDAAKQSSRAARAQEEQAIYAAQSAQASAIAAQQAQAQREAAELALKLTQNEVAAAERHRDELREIALRHEADRTRTARLQRLDAWLDTSEGHQFKTWEEQADQLLEAAQRGRRAFQASLANEARSARSIRDEELPVFDPTTTAEYQEQKMDVKDRWFGVMFGASAGVIGVVIAVGGLVTYLVLGLWQFLGGLVGMMHQNTIEWTGHIMKMGLWAIPIGLGVGLVLFIIGGMTEKDGQPARDHNEALAKRITEKHDAEAKNLRDVRLSNAMLNATTDVDTFERLSPFPPEFEAYCRRIQMTIASEDVDEKRAFAKLDLPEHVGVSDRFKNAELQNRARQAVDVTNQALHPRLI